MFVVLMLICSTYRPMDPCFFRRVYLRGILDKQHCMATALMAAKTLHIANPNWTVRNAVCLPTEET